MDDNLDCHDHFIRLHSLDVSNVDAIVAVIKDVILPINLNLKNCQAMLWWLFNNKGRKDGCGKADQIGGTKGITYSLFRTFVKFAVGDAIEASKVIKNSLETTSKVTKLIKKLVKRERYQNHHWTRGSKEVGDDIHDIILVTIFTMHFCECYCL